MTLDVEGAGVDPPDRAAPRAPGGVSGRRMPELDGLRGLAILIVVAFHVENVACLFFPSGPCPSAPLALVRAGHTGVTLFFVLSAFLLSLPLFEVGERRFETGVFYKRRALRILPLYWTVIVVGGLLSSSRPRDMLAVLPFLVFLNGLWPIRPISPYTDVTWSLATEAQFYTLLPLLPWLFSPARRRVRWAMLAAVVGLYGALVRGLLDPIFGVAVWFVGPTIIGRGPVFLFGILAAWVYARFGSRLGRWRPLAVWGDLALVACFVALELMLRPVAQQGYVTWEYPPRVAWHVPEAALWTTILLLVVIAPMRSKRLVANSVMDWIGVRSYSIFLLHLPILIWSSGVVRQAFPRREWAALSAGWVVASLAVIAGLSAVSYRLIELPFLVRKSRITGAGAALRLASAREAVSASRE